MSDKITRAVYKAIAEKVIEQLEWDATIGKYVLPEGFIFCIDAPIARIAAKDLGLTLKPEEQAAVVDHCILNGEKVMLPVGDR
jgi:hypothetical protein